MYHPGSLATPNSYNDETKTPIIQSVQCNGTEETLFDCEFSNCSDYQCSSYGQDAGIVCQGLHSIQYCMLQLATACYNNRNNLPHATF